MKSKYITIGLSAILICCIGVNIYQYVTTSNLKQSLSTLTNSKNELTAEIDNKTAELNNITIKIEEANNTISNLTAEKEGLSLSNQELQAQLDELQEDIETVEEQDTSTANLTEEDMEAAEQILKELEEEHPEWFTDTSGNTSEGNYEHVGTPSTGELTNPNSYGSGDASGLDKNAQVY
ncbi:MAG: hypothetical protein NC548_53465 [Lachnospiraceae bacterium]|nr:hypothetical protein [Lachnospiraceae bacterium]